MPKLSVIMPVYNAISYLPGAVESILNQTFSDFELIIIDDASTDDSVSYLRTLKDPRVRIFYNEVNIGNGLTRNVGLDAAQGEYITLLDGDDISHPDRFLILTRFMDAHPDITLCGSCGRRFGDLSHPQNEQVLKFHGGDTLIKALIPFKYTFLNASVILRSAIAGHVRYPDLRRGPDQSYIARIALAYKVTNIPDILYYYRITPGSVTFTQSDTYRVALYRELLQLRLGYEPSDQDVNAHIAFLYDHNTVLSSSEVRSHLWRAMTRGRHTPAQWIILACYLKLAFVKAAFKRLLCR